MKTYRIMGSYQGRVECVDSALSYAEAKTYLMEYKQAFGHGWSLWISPEKFDGEAAKRVRLNAALAQEKVG